jgi:DNA-binding response OmpR family regulator
MLRAREYVVVTFSPQPSVADFLKRITDEAGFASQAASTVDELERIVEDVMPDALVYEIGFPFSDNWHRLTQMRTRPMFQRLPVVITTADAQALYHRVGIPAIELFRKPDDLTELREAVLGAIETAA